ncbi:hypothetical protein [Mycobacteroides abscessus]|uniref:Uncharacterized protein n=3 Tax=Mycobacteroides abscessus TaxID=36809 RepID=B1MNL0_MYCA9|nr:hypothetical protein [Mycobacteroides abscessus]EUA60336.1 hypothetical protein I542_0468 [Mycobacteroides abscessus 1948]ALM16212.1 hypothetical protein AOY11_08045 [Mycobacteroides abscessus]AMU45369.1 hypothetical protein A3O00_09085 [Mycobacteroides abscessus]AMU50274.1 hypothetical protein A3O01_09075 [Mycobacteroides abscessus]ANO08952.1 hypothetical protein BAB76_09085 [Mycobacteroides abscessus]
MSVRDYQFDMAGMSPEDRERAATGAQGILHMEEGAGKTMAQKLLVVRDSLNDALKAAERAQEVAGFGELQTGYDVTKFYKDQSTEARAKITADRDAVQKQIDHFLAMELLYKNQDDYNAGNFGAYQASVVY